VNVVWWDLSIFFAIGQQFGGLCGGNIGDFVSGTNRKGSQPESAIGETNFWLA
jgi:hypothetical protein